MRLRSKCFVNRLQRACDVRLSLFSLNKPHVEYSLLCESSPKPQRRKKYASYRLMIYDLIPNEIKVFCEKMKTTINQNK